MIAAHTHGPYVLRHGDGYTDIEGTDGHGRIARVYTRPTKTNNLTERDANAALFMAAPETAAELARVRAENAELVAAFTDVMEIIDHIYEGARWHSQAVEARARAALAKVTP